MGIGEQRFQEVFDTPICRLTIGSVRLQSRAMKAAEAWIMMMALCYVFRLRKD